MKLQKALTGLGFIPFSMKCLTCGKPVEWQDNPYRPFCSERCKLIDLGCWVNEEYAVPGERVTIPDEADSPSERSAGEE